MMQTPIPRQSHIKERALKASNHPRRPSAISTRVSPRQNHACRDLRTVAVFEFIHMFQCDVFYHIVGGQLVITFNIWTIERSEFASILVHLFLAVWNFLFAPELFEL